MEAACERRLGVVTELAALSAANTPTVVAQGPLGSEHRSVSGGITAAWWPYKLQVAIRTASGHAQLQVATRSCRPQLTPIAVTAIAGSASQL